MVKKIFILFFSVYLFLSPLDMILNISGTATLLRYLGIILISISLFDLVNTEINTHNIYILIILIVILMLAFMSFMFSSFPISFPISLLNLSLFYVVLSIRKYSTREIFLYLLSIILSAVVLTAIMFMNRDTMIIFDRVSIIINDKFVDPNDMSANLIFPLLISYSLIKGKIIQKITFTLTSLIVIYGILLTGSRGGYLSAIVSSVFYFLPVLYHRGKKHILTIVIFGILMFFIFKTLPSNIVERLSLNSIFYSGGSGRTTIWRNVMSVISELSVKDFLLGKGLSSFPYFYESSFNTYVGSHNFYIQIFIELGVISFLLFVSFILIHLYRAFKTKSELLISSVVFIMTISLSLEIINKKFFWNTLLIVSILIINMIKKEKRSLPI